MMLGVALFVILVHLPVDLAQSQYKVIYKSKFHAGY